MSDPIIRTTELVKLRNGALLIFPFLARPLPSKRRSPICFRTVSQKVFLITLSLLL